MPPTATETSPDVPAICRLAKALQLDGWSSQGKCLCLFGLGEGGGTIVELGVWAGRSLAAMGLGACHANRPHRLIGIDAYDPKLCGEGLELDHRAWRSMPTVMQEYAKQKATVRDNLKSLGLEPDIRFASSADARISWADGAIDLLHVDGNHGEIGAEHDLTKWVELVRPGGTVVVDDLSWPGVAAVVKRLGITFEFEHEGPGEHWGTFRKA